MTSADGGITHDGRPHDAHQYPSRMRLLWVLSYLSILTVIYGGLSPGTAAIVLLAIVLAHSAAGYRTFILAPFLLYPFMFLVRIPDHDNAILVTISDIAAILSISAYIVMRRPPRAAYGKVRLITLLLLIYAMFSFVNQSVHLFELRLLPSVFRQYTLPIIFVLVFISACYRDETLTQRALAISVLSFAIVGSISLLNYAGIVRIPPLYPEIFPYSGIPLDEEYNVVGRDVLGLGLIPRLNLFTGGALGSSAAIFVTLALLSFFGFVKRISRPVTIAIGVLLTIPAALTISFSILYPIVFLIILYVIRRGSAVSIITGGWAAGLLLLSGSLFGRSAYAYFTSAILPNLSESVHAMTPSMFIFGMGPRLTAKNFASPPVNLSGDIGIFRIFVESGILNFLLFTIIILLIMRRGVASLRQERGMETLPFLLVVAVMASQVHTNMTAVPPFYPLFAVGAAGVFVTAARKSAAS